ncbi:MAG TPA: ferrochelatase [Verrucomicrobiae bacterium]|jgi:ferrochelatase|nr:ferrochelatase [Verrucomicrobiae bacterium]
MSPRDRYDGILLLAFGGPRAPEEIRPFLDRVLTGRSAPPGRIDEVVHHYQAVGGCSPLSDITLLQANALERLLEQMGRAIPVHVGFRHSKPYIQESLAKMSGEGVKRVLAFILSSHRTEASWERYQENVREARDALAGKAPAVDYCPGWHDHPLFLETWANQIANELDKTTADRGEVALIFTAHSVPTAMAERSSYVAELEDSCRLVAKGLGRDRWSLAYQSRSGNPREPWLEPDIAQALRFAAAHGVKAVVVAPIGFVADHVEVLYDLDIEARKIAEESGIKFYRAGTPNDHPLFIRMIADVVERKLSADG